MNSRRSYPRVKGVCLPSPTWMMQPSQPFMLSLSLLWAVAGVALPTGAQAIAGRGAQPYIQVPASVDLWEGTTLAAQYVATFHPGDVETAPEHQASLDLEVDVSETFGLFLEYTGTYRHGETPVNTADLGATWRLDQTHQVDFLVGRGLNAAAPDWYFSIGYSLRFDRLF